MNLPVEIVRTIFEEASRSSPSAALQLLQLSTVTKEWTVPILYRTVTIRTYSQFESFRLALDYGGVHHPGTYVRQLYLLLPPSRYPNRTDLCVLLTRCPNLVHYAVSKLDFIPEINEGSESGVTTGRSVQRFSICLCNPWATLGPFPSYFLRLTHLHLFCPGHAFYNLLDPDSGNDFPNLLSLVIEITQPCDFYHGRGVPFHEVIGLAALVDQMSSLRRFLEKSTSLQELVLKLQVPSSTFPGILRLVAQLKKVSLVYVTQEPFDELWRRPKEQAVAVRGWQDRIFKALNEMNDRWQNV